MGERSLPPAPPVVSDDERLRRLERANTIRFQRAAEKRRWKGLPPWQALREGARLILQPPDWAASWRIGDVLEELPTVGRVSAARVLREEKIAPRRTLGALSPRQRLALAARVERQAQRFLAGRRLRGRPPASARGAA